MNEIPLVSIKCLVYNHEPYLRQCLEGFVMQKTTFPFEAIVHDDASTDGSADIIREYAKKYPNIIKPIYETENQYSKHNGFISRIMNTHMRGKYIAICEGDDYWIDPFKLQKQVDYLENHPECGLCYTKAKTYYQTEQRFGKEWGGPFTQFEQIMNYSNIPTLSTLYRKELYNKYLDDVRPHEHKWLMGDFPLWIWLSHESQVCFMPFVTGVYRYIDNSASHSSSAKKLIAFGLSGLAIKKFYYDKYGISSKNKFDIVKSSYLCKLKAYALTLNYIMYINTLFSYISEKGIKVLFDTRIYKYCLLFVSKRLRESHS